jgi:hypothetical protein
VSSDADSRRRDLLETLRRCANLDPYDAHVDADDALLDYIGDAEISAAFYSVPRWYS